MAAGDDARFSAAAQSASDLQRIAAIGQTDQITSNQSHLLDYLQSANFTEYWSNLSAWNAAGVQVSGGKLYGPSTTVTVSAAHHAFAVPQNTRLRARFTLTVPAPTPGSNGLAMVGLNTAAAGSAPLAGAPATFGIGVLTNDNSVTGFVNGGFVPITAAVGTPPAALSAGTYSAWVFTDEYGVNLYLCDAAHNFELLLLLNWAAGPSNYPNATIPAVNNLAVFNSDSRGTSGIGIGSVGVRGSSATVTPRTGIEGTTPTAITFGLSSTDGTRVQFPTNYDSRKPSPVIFFFHGAGQDEQAPMSDPLSRALFQSLSTAGFTLISSRGNSVQNWGNQAALDAYFAAYLYYRDRYALGPICALSESMGGLAGLLTLAERRLPNIVAWAGIYPVCSLANMYGAGAGAYAGNIAAAYSITGGNPYATATAGHDPLLLGQAKSGAFRNLPMRFYASYDDTVVTRTGNTDAFQALIAPGAPESTIVTCTGNHGDPSHFQASDLIAFYRRYLPF